MDVSGWMPALEPTSVSGTNLLGAIPYRRDARPSYSLLEDSILSVQLLELDELSRAQTTQVPVTLTDGKFAFSVKQNAYFMVNYRGSDGRAAQGLYSTFLPTPQMAAPKLAIQLSDASSVATSIIMFIVSQAPVDPEIAALMRAGRLPLVDALKIGLAAPTDDVLALLMVRLFRQTHQFAVALKSITDPAAIGVDFGGVEQGLALSAAVEAAGPAPLSEDAFATTFVNSTEDREAAAYQALGAVNPAVGLSPGNALFAGLAASSDLAAQFAAVLEGIFAHMLHLEAGMDRDAAITAFRAALGTKNAVAALLSARGSGTASFDPNGVPDVVLAGAADAPVDAGAYTAYVQTTRPVRDVSAQVQNAIANQSGGGLGSGSAGGTTVGSPGDGGSNDNGGGDAFSGTATEGGGNTTGDANGGGMGGGNGIGGSNIGGDDSTQTYDITPPVVPNPKVILTHFTGRSVHYSFQAATDNASADQDLFYAVQIYYLDPGGLNTYVAAEASAYPSAPMTGTLTGLLPLTDYRIEVYVYDLTGNVTEYVHPDNDFTTPAAGTVAPTVQDQRLAINPLHYSASIAFFQAIDDDTPDYAMQYYLDLYARNPDGTRGAAIALQNYASIHPSEEEPGVFDLTFLDPDTAYDVVVRAVDLDDNVLVYSDAATSWFRTQALPGAPAILGLSAANNHQVLLSFSVHDDAASYTIEIAHGAESGNAYVQPGDAQPVILDQYDGYLFIPGERYTFTAYYHTLGDFAESAHSAPLDVVMPN